MADQMSIRPRPRRNSTSVTTIMVEGATLIEDEDRRVEEATMDAVVVDAMTLVEDVVETFEVEGVVALGEVEGAFSSSCIGQSGNRQYLQLHMQLPELERLLHRSKDMDGDYDDVESSMVIAQNRIK